MKTLTTFSATCKDSAQPARQEAASQVRITQAQAGFWRRIRAAADGFYFEASNKTQVFVPHTELWKIVEVNEPGLALPKTN